MKKIIKLILKPFVALSFSLGCLLGLHAYKNGECVYCHKKQ